MKKLALFIAMGLVLSGCGGSSGGGSSSNENTTPTLSRISGSIENIDANNSITVNGKSYAVDLVQYGNENLTTDVLAPNMMVQLMPKANTQKVDVKLEPTITGKVDAIDYIAKTFTVNGVTLSFSELTNDIKNDIDPGDWVMVYTQPTATAEYKVLGIFELDVDSSYPNLSTHYEIEGRISDIDTNAKTLVLGSNITIYYGYANELPRLGLQIGQWVEIEGTMSGNDFIAREIELDEYDQYDGDNEVEGIVTWVANDQSSFSLNHRGTFQVDSSTYFEDGNKVDLKQGAKVEITYTIKSGNLFAKVIDFERPDRDDYWESNEFECEGIVSNYDMNQGTFTISRCENDLDQPINNTVVIDAQTRFKRIDKLNLNGQKVEVEGIIINNRNIAQEIEPYDYD